jgi:thioredoxin-dependent peroxiredoxin
MVELRKRKAAPEPPPPAKKRAPASKKQDTKTKPTDQDQTDSKPGETKSISNDVTDGSSHKSGAPVVGDTINLEGFGGALETQDGTKMTLKELIDQSKAGVVLFTYPK